jgi:hypothetical protein
VDLRVFVVALEPLELVGEELVGPDDVDIDGEVTPFPARDVSPLHAARARAPAVATTVVTDLRRRLGGIPHCA